MTHKRLSAYWPLIALTVVSALAGLAINADIDGGMSGWMHGFMGIFLIMFSTLKLFHLQKFADGFEKYDLIAKRSRAYACLYPLIELTLGLAYLSFSAPILTYILTIIVLGMGSVGVIMALRAGLNINCPCMGSVLEVPLSTVTLTEDLAMVVMAVVLLLASLT